MTDLSRIAADTNLLTYSTSRRLLHGIALERSQSLCVLPEVLVEAKRRIAIAESRRCECQLDSRDDVRYKRGETRERIIEAVGEAATQWFVLELGRDDTAFEQLELTVEQRRRSRKFARSIPPKAIKKGQIEFFEEGGDPVIIGEALAFEVTLLSTNNFRTINHDLVNAWVTRELGRNSWLLYGPNETLRYLAEDDISAYYQWMVTHGLNLFHDDSDMNRSAMHDVFERFESSGFQQCAFLAEREFEVDTEFEHKVQIARNSPHHAAAIRSEQRLRHATRTAAEQAGWER